MQLANYLTVTTVIIITFDRRVFVRHSRHTVVFVNYYRYRSLLENQGSQQGLDLTRIGDHDLSMRSSQNNHYQGGVSGVILTAARRRVS